MVEAQICTHTIFLVTLERYVLLESNVMRQETGVHRSKIAPLTFEVVCRGRI